MRENHVKQKACRGEAAVGAMLGWPSPQLVEFCSLAGFEWVVFDAEHGPIDVSMCEQMVRAAESFGIVPFVRVPTNNRIEIMSYLQIGVMGICVPHVNTREEAEHVVKAVKYPPQGSRYADTSARGAYYGLLKPNVDIYREANDRTMVIVWVEEVQALENLSEILTVEGIDAVNIGAFDLAHTMGHQGQPDHPDVQKAIGRARRQIIKSGKALVGETCDAESVPALLDHGARLILTSVKHLWHSSMTAYLADYHSHIQTCLAPSHGTTANQSSSRF